MDATPGEGRTLHLRLDVYLTPRRPDSLGHTGAGTAIAHALADQAAELLRQRAEAMGFDVMFEAETWVI